jgi:flagellar hook-associated protein 3 FlgL
MDNYVKLSNLQEQIATGRRLNRPSDNPVDVTNDMEMRGKLQALGQYKRNIDDAVAFCGVTDSALITMNDLFQRMKELALQASNDTYSAEQRNYVNKEVNQLIRQFMVSVNSTYKGEYIFGGTNTQTEPYTIKSGTGALVTPAFGTALQIDDTASVPPVLGITNLIPGNVVVTDGAAVTYEENVDYAIDYINGTITPLAGGAMVPAANFTVTFEYVQKAALSNTDSIYREIEENVTPRINVSADDFIVDPVNSVNTIEAFITFGQALVQNDSGTIRTAITQIGFAFENCLSAQATNGSRVNRFTLTLERNEIQVVETTQLQSELEDADLAEVITNFSLMENVYTASLKAGAHVIQPSLMDFLR